MINMQLKRSIIGMPKSQSWDAGWTDSGSWTRGEHATWLSVGMGEIVYSHWRHGWLAFSWSRGEYGSMRR